VFPHGSFDARAVGLPAEKRLQMDTDLTLPITKARVVSDATTSAPDLQKSQALFRTRTGDPLLTMEVLYQLS
jgi:hypothetical protein